MGHLTYDSLRDYTGIKRVLTPFLKDIQMIENVQNINTYLNS